MTRSKYNAKRTVVDGITFASKAEARRYGELKILERVGKISDLELQKKFPLYVCGIKIGNYIADFVYFDASKLMEVIEDVKGIRTPMFNWKKKHFEAQYGMEIAIVK